MGYVFCKGRKSEGVIGNNSKKEKDRGGVIGCSPTEKREV